MELRLNRVSDAKATLLRSMNLESKDGQHYTMLGDYFNYYPLKCRDKFARYD